LRPLRTIAIYFSDIIVGISNDTLLEFVGRNANAKRKGRILYYGIDLRPFEIVSDKELFRKQLGMPGSAKILLFIGRLNSFKNPLFVVVILHELLKSRNDVYAVFVGKGDLEGDIFSMAVELGIIEHIRILGWSDSTSQIMKDSDVFVFPRVEYPKEGLGLVIVEAQAAGLSMIISNGIVEDAIVIKELVYYSSLNDPPSFWARNIEEILANKPAVSQIQALELMKSSRFDLREATQNFIDLYE
jgi:glycosyltransferase involved in cell wall biosynthesis